MPNADHPDSSSPENQESPPVAAAEILPSSPKTFRTRLFEGLLMALPVVITIWIVFWLYRTFRDLVIDPLAALILWLITDPTPVLDAAGNPIERVQPWWFEQVAAPLMALVSVILLLYLLGIFFHTWLHRAIDWLMLKLPLVEKIYGAVQKVAQSIGGQRTADKFKRVVLVEFPHPGMKAPAFVTNTCRDAATGKTILTVYVPTTPVPTSGYMLLVPEEDVIELSWDLNETLQAIISGGITVPEHVEYYRADGTIEPLSSQVGGPPKL